MDEASDNIKETAIASAVVDEKMRIFLKVLSS